MWPKRHKFKIEDYVKIISGPYKDKRIFQVMMYPSKEMQQSKEINERFPTPIFVFPVEGGHLCIADESWLEKIEPSNPEDYTYCTEETS